MALLPEPQRSAHRSARHDAASEATRRFVAENWHWLICHFGAFACQTLVMYGVVAWGPAMLIRVHGLPMAGAGLGMALAAGVFGTCGFLAGGALFDRQTRRGEPAAGMGIAAAGMACAVPMGIAAALAPSAFTAAIFLCLFFFALLLPTPAGITGLQLLVPSQLRGRISGLFMVVTNLFGLGVGPLLVGLLNDHVFADKSAVWLALLVIIGVFAPLGSIAFLTAGRFIAAQARVK